jgi:hypothetical protein
MTETLSRLLLRLSEAEHPVLWGRVAAPHFGREFDRLLAQRVLVEDPPTDTWAVCSDCDCDLDARPIQQIHGQRVAVCSQDHRSDVHLSDDDIRSYRIDPALLVGLIGKASGLNRPPEAILPGVWRLANVFGSQAVFLALSVSATTQPALLGMLTRAAQGTAATLLVPRGMPEESRRLLEDSGIHVVVTTDVMGNEAPFALEAERLVPANMPKLRLSRGRLAVTLFGTEGTLAKRPFDLLWILAEAGGTIVERRIIEAHMWSQPVAKTAVNDAVRDLREGLAAIDPRSENLIETKAGQGYRVALAPGEMVLNKSG